MSDMRVIGGVLYAVCGATVLICGCGKSEAPKTPLGEAPAASTATGGAMTSGITGEAKLALDSGNQLFRAKAYDKALGEYQRAADLAPTELAPLLGVMMVAEITNDAKLAEATVPRIRKLDPSYADSSAISHSKMMKAHPGAVVPPAA